MKIYHFSHSVFVMISILYDWNITLQCKSQVDVKIKVSSRGHTYTKLHVVSAVTSVSLAFESKVDMHPRPQDTQLTVMSGFQVYLLFFSDNNTMTNLMGIVNSSMGCAPIILAQTQRPVISS